MPESIEEARTPTDRERESLLNGQWLAGLARPDRLPRIPGNSQHYEGYREADERIGTGDANPNQERTRDHPERHIAIYAGMIAVGDKRRTCQSPACPGFRVGAICVGDDRVSARGPRELPSAAGPERNAERRRACSPGTTDGVLRLPRVERSGRGFRRSRGRGSAGAAPRCNQTLWALLCLLAISELAQPCSFLVRASTGGRRW
jgi:hypothetical protein